MSVMQNYGVLRVVRGNHGSREKIAKSESSMREDSTDQGQRQAPPPWTSEGEQASSLLTLEEGQIPPLLASKTMIKQRHKYLGRWLPEERLAHILSQRETTIGRALSSDIILLDPTVSRDHARLVLGEEGWCVQNVTENNVVRVNGHNVAGGAWSPLRPQDLLVIGNTTLQLVAPLPGGGSVAEMNGWSDEEEWGQVPSVLGFRVTMQFALRRLLQYPRTDRRNGEKSLPSLVPPNVDYSNETIPTISSSLALWRTRSFFISGGLLSLVVLAGVWLVLSSLNSLFGLAQDGPYRLMLALVMPLIPALGINMLVHFIDRYECEPWFLRLAAFLWGAIIAIPPARLIESFIDGFVTHLWGLDSQVVLHAFLSGLDAGLTEETLKALGLLLLLFLLRDKFDNVTDGIVYGALIGAGFAMVENFYYFLNNTNDVSALIVGRIVLGWLSHSTFTVCFGIALGYIRHTRVRWRQTVIPWLGYLLAVSLHTIFDFIEIFVRDMVPTYGNSPTVARLAILAVIGNYIPLFLVQVGIVFILIKSLMHEAAIIREFLPSEVAEGVVTVDEYALLPHSSARIRLERHVLWHYGIRQWLLTRALYQAEIGLAFCKWHVSVLQCSATDQRNEEGPMPLLTLPGEDNSNGTTPNLSSRSHWACPNSFAPGYLQPEIAYRKRIKRIRQEIAATRDTKPLD